MSRSGRTQSEILSRGWMLSLFLLVPLSANADGERAKLSPSIWISPGIYSQHFDSSKSLRNDNWGLSVEAVLAKDHALIGGGYINSNRAHTRYAAYEWRPMHWQVTGLNVSAGVAVGAFDGYPNYRNGGWFVAPLPIVAVEGERFGVNLSVIPTIRNRLDGALAIQAKFKVW